MKITTGLKRSTPTGLSARGGGEPAGAAGDDHDVPRSGTDYEYPGFGVTGRRGGIHNSVTRVCPKPTHMIGGYAQLAYGFNYYGTVGSNRDEFIMIRKMKNIAWLDDEGRDQVQEAKK